MFLWDTVQREVVGGYRMGPTDLIVNAHGPKGLYTHSLFRLSDRLIDKLRDGAEMGRSFIRPEQQRSYTALLMLWRGIGAYVIRNPRYRYLYGPVSISNDYHPLSQQILVAMLKRHKFDAEHANDVRPRKPFRVRENELPSLDAIDDTDSCVLADLLGTEPSRLRSLGRLAAPLSAMSILGVVAVVIGASVADRTDLIVPLTFVFVSMLTMPHLLVVERIWSAHTLGTDREGSRP